LVTTDNDENIIEGESGMKKSALVHGWEFAPVSPIKGEAVIELLQSCDVKAASQPDLAV
jgi:hypothetical protein